MMLAIDLLVRIEAELFILFYPRLLINLNFALKTVMFLDFEI